VAAARALPFTFTLTARAENFLHGRPDIKDTIQRLQAYQDAGADVLYAPGLTTKDDIAAVVSSVDRPVNVVMGLRGVQLSLAELSAIGVRRISVGSALTRTALGAFLRAAREMHDQGTFTFAREAANPREIGAMFDSSDNR
jgi:2-methylisocitrate lyase-like PEP mutase family enzyme